VSISLPQRSPRAGPSILGPKREDPAVAEDHPTQPEVNPIVALATRLRARRDVESAVDAALPAGPASAGGGAGADAEVRLGRLGAELRLGAERLNSILRARGGVTYVRLERPLRLRLRFGEKRIALDLDAERQLVLVNGEGLDGEYQFDAGSDVPALINLSKLSTEAGYGEALTASALLKTIARDAELPRPAHLDGPGPIPL
jgi:hypothetical protein